MENIVDKYELTKERMPLVYEAGERLQKIDDNVVIALPLTFETLCVIDAIRSKVTNLTIIPQSSGEHSSIEPGVFPYLNKWEVKHLKTTSDSDKNKIFEKEINILVDCSFELGKFGFDNKLLNDDTIIIEDTKTGENRIDELGIRNPYCILDNSRIKRELENKVGIGYSVLGALLGLGYYLPSSKIGIIGYGYVGSGLVYFLAKIGADVVLYDINDDRMKAAQDKGYSAVDKKSLLKHSDIIITATGKDNVITSEELSSLNKTLVLANAGGENEWIRKDLIESSRSEKQLHPQIREFVIGNSKIHELAGGNSLNLVMNISVSRFLDATFAHLINIISQITEKKVRLVPGFNDIKKFDDTWLIDRIQQRGMFLDY